MVPRWVRIYNRFRTYIDLFTKQRIKNTLELLTLMEVMELTLAAVASASTQTLVFDYMELTRINGKYAIDSY